MLNYYINLLRTKVLIYSVKFIHILPIKNNIATNYEVRKNFNQVNVCLEVNGENPYKCNYIIIISFIWLTHPFM